MYSQDNIEALFALMGETTGEGVRRTKNYDGIQTNGSVWPNQLYNFQIEEHELEQVLSEIENRVHHNELPGLYMSNPATDKTFLIDALKRRGYASNLWTAMTHPLDTVLKVHPPAGLMISPVLETIHLRPWLDIVESELMGGAALNRSLFEKMLGSSDVHFYTGHIQSQPVSTAMLFKNEGQGGIYLVATLTEFRRKGIGRAMTAHCLDKAQTLGLNQVCIQATMSGLSVYQSLGFEDCGKIEVFRIAKLR